MFSSKSTISARSISTSNGVRKATATSNSSTIDLVHFRYFSTKFRNFTGQIKLSLIRCHRVSASLFGLNAYNGSRQRTSSRKVHSRRQAEVTHNLRSVSRDLPWVIDTSRFSKLRRFSFRDRQSLSSLYNHDINVSTRLAGLISIFLRMTTIMFSTNLHRKIRTVQLTLFSNFNGVI